MRIDHAASHQMKPDAVDLDFREKGIARDGDPFGQRGQFIFVLAGLERFTRPEKTRGSLVCPCADFSLRLCWQRKRSVRP